MSDSQIKVNENIEKYLDSYIKKEGVQYATLLTGKWGCGKTYFIKEYITKKENEYKFIYVSLFGLKTIDSVNEIIFSQLHPILSSKPARLITNIFKSAVKLGIQLDLHSDDKNDTTLNLDPDKLNFFESDNYSKNIFIFDDLERCFIPYNEILGFINNLTEHHSLKTILIANTDEIEDDNQEIFDKFKEKVINRTFVVQNNDGNFWEVYYEKYPILKDFSDEIKDIFQKYSDNNFRLLMQATDNYLDFIENFKDTEFFKNDEFKKNVNKAFFIILYFL